MDPSRGHSIHLKQQRAALSQNADHKGTMIQLILVSRQAERMLHTGAHGISVLLACSYLELRYLTCAKVYSGEVDITLVNDPP